MKHIALLLHIYQPPTQDAGTVRLIDSECYSPLADLLTETSARITLNINYSLTEQLSSLAPGTLGRLSSAGGFELCTSGAYHPILPLLPPAEAGRQIRLNTEGNGAFFPDKPVAGVFPPEMAWDPSMSKLIAGTGCRWSITDDIPWVHSGLEAPADWIPSSSGVGVFMRSNFWSNRIAFHEDDGADTAARMVQGLTRWRGAGDSYLITALDGETFGHHRKGALESFLRPFLLWFSGRTDARLSTLSDLSTAFPYREAVVPAGSWSTTPADLDRGVPWPLWNDPANRDHTHLTALRNLVLDWARRCRGGGVAALADRMLYSCPFWWASPGRYDPVQIRRGVGSMLETAVAAFRETGDRKTMDMVLTAAGAVPSMCRRG